ncbi:hypothetical protein [Flavobacterium wongokense]|uniref:hypothetical protein n=1 Tax=Flavobacterium wongokense TaxID=2910674 RepID=UPI001F1824A3|nr:hypothetical protein [Flavobacterium sp. WG47]MCF6132596.1 hypothetical protein [Flavobacterium sp. WG47]
MKKIALLLTILISVSMNAQFKLKVNGKPVAETATIKAEDIKKMEVAFDKPKKLDYYGLGKLIVFLQLVGEDGNIDEEYYFVKNGQNSIKSFLEDVNSYFPVPSDSDKQSEFGSYKLITDESITTKLKYLGKNYGSKIVKLKFSMGYRDKIGYEKYGDLVYLIKPQTWSIDNNLFYTEGQKEKEQDKIVAAQKAEEKAKADEEARKQKEIEDKKGKGKKLIKNVLGW